MPSSRIPKRLARRHPVAWRALLRAALLLACGACSGEPERPNVLLVTIDTLRADRTGPYGFGLARTPAMDRLAAEGVVCENAVAAAPITLPSHATMMTGLLPPAHGVRDNGAYALGPEAVTLAERLSDTGYETRAFVSAAVLDQRYGLAQGFDSYDDDLWAEDRPPLFMVPDRPGARTAERFERWYATRPREEAPPFFAWVHFFDPHQPYEAPTADRLRSPTAYDAEIAAADRALGRVIAALEERGELDDTVVIVTADHGESLGEHGEKTHAVFVYDATVKVPLLVRYPHRFPEGARLAAPVHHVDLVPTVLSLLGLPGGERTQGFDLSPALAGKDPHEGLRDRAQYVESLLSEVGFGMAPLFGVRHDGHKWIRAPRPELYDLEEDPRELVNLAGEEPRRARALERRLQDLLDESATRQVGAELQPMEQETLEMLQALGYLAPAAERSSMEGMDPKDGIALYRRLEEARHHAQREEWEQARSVAREVVEALPKNVSAWNVLGIAAARSGDVAAARDAYLRSLAVEPRQSRVHVMLGVLDLEDGRLAEARRAFERALEITPDFVEGMAHLGLVAAVEGDEDGAERWYRRAIEADPGYPRVWRRQGDLFFERGEPERALAAYEKALENEPKDFLALLQAGASARRTGDPAAARIFLQRAAAVRLDSWLPAYNLACLEAVEGDQRSALDHLTYAVILGFDAPEVALEDPDLASLHDDERFRELLVAMRHPGARARLSPP